MRDNLIKLLFVGHETSKFKWETIKWWETTENWSDLPDFFPKEEIDKYDKVDIGKVIENWEKNNISFITLYDKEYPEYFKELEKYPFIIFYRGDISLLKHNKRLSVVGSRRSPYEMKKLTEKWCEELAMNGVCIISGLAVGIDIHAHIGALNGNGYTVAVMGCGVDIAYPSINRKWKEKIEKEGLVISEYLPSSPPQKYYFPFRNRLIATIGEGLLVVTGTKKSGTMITVGWALDMGRTVMAVPGSVMNYYSEGPNYLIKNGAVPITSVDDIKDEMGIKESRKKIKYEDLSEEEKRIIDLINQGDDDINSIIRSFDKNVGDVFMLIMNMELKGIITKAGNKLCVNYHI